jgi:hypothetical protein
MNSIRGDASFTQTTTTTTTTVRPADLTAAVQEATLQPAIALTPQQIQAHNAFYNLIGDNSSKLSDTSLWLPPWPQPDPSLQQWLEDMMVGNATAPRFGDNCQASELRKEYRDNYNQVQHEVSQAQELGRRLGPGCHKMENGETVDVKENPNDPNHLTVTITRPDGSSKTTEVNGDQSSVTYKNQDGSTEKLQQHGTGVTRTDTDANGRTQSWKYHLDADGRPVREYNGTDEYGDKQDVITTANWDGSTNTRRLVGYDGGIPLWEDSYDPPEYPYWWAEQVNAMNAGGGAA